MPLNGDVVWKFADLLGERHEQAFPGCARNSAAGFEERALDAFGVSSSGLTAEQVSQVRGFADQRPREGKKPDDPVNRRISLIVEYVVKDTPADEGGAPTPAKAAEGEVHEH